jgi:hypothetical protein
MNIIVYLIIQTLVSILLRIYKNKFSRDEVGIVYIIVGCDDPPHTNDYDGAKVSVHFYECE